MLFYFSQVMVLCGIANVLHCGTPHCGSDVEEKKSKVKKKNS